MSPIDNHLRDTLAERAHEVAPSPDVFTAVQRRARSMQRRRIAVATTGTAAITALAVLGGMWLSDPGSRQGVRIAPAAPSGSSSTPSAMANPTPADTATPNGPMPINMLRWQPRGDTPSVDPRVAGGSELWSRKHGVPASSVQTAGLWYGPLPDDSVVSVFQAWSTDKGKTLPDAFTVIYVRTHDGQERLVRDDPTWYQPLTAGAALSANKYDVGKIAQLSAVVTDGGTSYVVVVGKPGTGQVRYAADGSHFSPVDTVDGVAVFTRTGPTTGKPDLIELLDGDGNPDQPTYRGPIDDGAVWSQ